MFDNFQNVFKEVSKQFGMIEKNQRLTDEQFTIAFRRNSPLRERLSLEAPSDNREKKKEKRVYSALRENFNIFIAREARARARSAPEDTNKRLRKIHRKPDRRRILAKKCPVGSPSTNFGHFGEAFKRRNQTFFNLFFKFLDTGTCRLKFLKFLRNFNLKVYWTRSERLQQKLVDSVPSITLVTLDQLTIVKTS